MAFCTQCGATLSDSAKFCSACGAAQGAPADTAPQHDAPVIPPPVGAPIDPNPGANPAAAAWSPPGAGPAYGGAPYGGHAPLQPSGPPKSLIVVIGAIILLVVVLAVVQPWKTPQLTGDKAAVAGGDAKDGGATAGGGTTAAKGDGGESSGADAPEVSGSGTGELAPVADAPGGGRTSVNDGSSVAVSAPTLHRAFLSDEGSAQRLYGDRPLLISGIVSSVQLNTGNPTVAFEGQNRFVSVLATFGPEARSAVAGLGKGISLTARCNGVRDIAGTPILQNCRF